MKIAGKTISPAWISAVLLFIAYLFSTGRALLISCSTGDHSMFSDGRIIRVAHWQLEPGYREGLQWAIDQYNQLPRVREAGITVEQIPVTERVYPQFLNVHLIAGTAPDIAVAAGSFTGGADAARFFAALGEFVNSPNPYNDPATLAAAIGEESGIALDLDGSLSNTPWRSTFADNLETGFNSQLNDYYAIPVSTWGAVRIFYNLELLATGKRFALEAAQSESEPQWLRQLWQTPENPASGFLLRNQANLSWLENFRQPPETLGQLILFCEALQAYAAASGQSTLVPISGSNYVSSDMTIIYRTPFLSGFHEDSVFFTGTGLNSLEIIDAFSRGIWNFEKPAVREYFKLGQQLSSYYPTGFLGLDREQALRRFVLGQAAIMAAGGWDASSVYAGVRSRDNPADQFEVAVRKYPLPAPGERWSEYLNARTNEATASGGVSFSIYKQTKSLDWTLDFLKFLTAQPINRRFNAEAGWLPVTSGAEPVEHMKPFVPMMEGIPEGWSLRPRYVTGALSFAWTQNLKRFFSGKSNYDEMAQAISDEFLHELRGVFGLWQSEFQRARDRSRARDRFTSIERLRVLRTGDEAAIDRELSLMEATLTSDEGVDLRNAWSRLYPDTPFLKPPVAK